MSEIPSDPVVRAWSRLVKAQHHVLGAVEADLRRAGLPPLAWYDVLLELRNGPGEGLRPRQLERRTLLPQHNISRLLARLEKAGHIERKPCGEDGRGHTVLMTERGLDLMRAVWPIYRAAIQRHVGGKLADDAEAHTLGDLLGRLIGSAKVG